MLAYVGSYDFGGLTACRRISGTALKGTAGTLFLFIVRQRITRDGGDECLFRFEPVFVRADGTVDEKAASLAVSRESVDDAARQPAEDIEAAFACAKKHLEEKTSIWLWTDDVEFLGLSWIEFT